MTDARPYRSWQKIDHAELVELLASGSSVNAASVHFKVTLASMQRYIKRHKLTVIYSANRFTPEQKKDIRRMAEHGIPLFYIAKLYKRNYNVIRVTLSRMGVKSKYHATGNKAKGIWGLPVSEQEIVDSWKGVYSWLRRKYKTLTDDELNDAVNQSSIEIRRVPRQSGFFGLWCVIAARRGLDLLAERKAGKRTQGAGKRVFSLDESGDEDMGGEMPKADYVDLQDEVKDLLDKLPVELKRIVKLHMELGGSDAINKLKISQATYYRKLNEAFDIIRSYNVTSRD